MKIIELRAENIKNLKVIEIKPDGNTNILTGANGAGKSAILDAICTALTGKKISDPIRDGEKRAEVTVKLEDFEVSKVFTPGGERLEVKSREGAKFASPQAFLNKIMGELTFDPLAFSKMKEVEQRALLVSLVKLDLSALEKEKEEVYQDRTIENRQVAALKAVADSLPKQESGLPKSELSMAKAIEELNGLEEKRSKYIDYENEKKRIADDIAFQERTIKSLESQVKNLMESIADNKKAIIILREESANLKAPEDISDDLISQKKAALEGIEQANIAIRAAKKNREKSIELETAQGKVDFLSARLSEIEDEKVEKIKNCKFPVEGLTISDDEVLFKGKPLSRYSTGQKIQISTAIAMALNPNLKILLIREGSDLDKAGLKSIIDIAKDKDYQLWIEKVADEKGVGIYIENGEIRG